MKKILVEYSLCFRYSSRFRKKNHFILVEVEEQRKQIGKKKITKENKVYHLVVSAQRIDMGNRSAGGPRQ